MALYLLGPEIVNYPWYSIFRDMLTKRGRREWEDADAASQRPQPQGEISTPEYSYTTSTPRHLEEKTHLSSGSTPHSSENDGNPHWVSVSREVWLQSELEQNMCPRVAKTILYLCTGRMGWMAYRKWKECKQQPGTAWPGNMLGCCLVSCGPSYVRRL